MTLSELELSVLNEFLNGIADAPVEVQAINTRIRELFSQDNSEVTPEVEATLEEEAVTPTEEVPETPAEAAPETVETPETETVATSEATS